MPATPAFRGRRRSARNRIIHGYDVVDYDIVWQIVTVEFPRLIEALEQVLPGHRS